MIDNFISSLTPESDINDDWNTFVRNEQKIQLDRIVEEENLKSEQTYKYITNAFRDAELQTAGTAIAEILPPVSRFSKDGARTQKREAVIEKLKKYFDKFWDISGGKFWNGNY